jgi:hypothetical protein
MLKELNMKRKRGAKMPPQQQLCFVMLLIAMCVQSAIPQTVNLEDASPGVGFTGTTLEIGTYKSWIPKVSE